MNDSILPHLNAALNATSFVLLVAGLYFKGEGFVRPVYFTILITHVTLAAAIVPLITVTLRRALRGDFIRHRRIARWTYPLWLYVSITGVIVYLMLYRLYPAR